MYLWGKLQHLWQQHLETESQHVPYQEFRHHMFYFNVCRFPSEKYQIFPAVMKKGLSIYVTYSNCSTKQSKKEKEQPTNPTFHLEHEVSLAASRSSSLTQIHGSYYPHMTEALWVAGSWSAGRLDPPFSQCSPTGGGLTSGHTLLQTTGDTETNAFTMQLTHVPPVYLTQPCFYLTVCKLAVL